MNWLITGGCGFIGRALVARILNEGSNAIRVFDNLSVGTREDLAVVGDFEELDPGVETSDWKTGLSLIEGDILNIEHLDCALKGADVIVHLAANTGVPQSVEDPIADCRTNVLGTLNLLEVCRSHNIQRFVFASSGAPLGAQSPPLHEEMAPHPASPYGASKLAGEGYCSAYYFCYGIETVALRFGNVYGEGSMHKTSVVAKFIKEALAGRNLEIYGDGTQTRDFIHISDLVRAILLASRTPGIGGQTFQIATAKETTIEEMTRKLIEVMRNLGIRSPNVEYGAYRSGDVKSNFSDTSKAFKLLGWSSSVSLSDGLERTVRYFVDE